MALDFSLLGQGPQFGNVLAAYDAGREQRKRTDTTNALALYATDPEKGIQALTKVDPLLGMKLQDDFTERQAVRAKKEIFANPDPKARAAAAQASGDPQVIEAVAKMDERQRAQAKELTDALGGFAFGLRKKPYEERKAILQAAAPDLEALGFGPDKLANIDPTDNYLDAQIMEAQTLAQQIEQANKDRDFKSAEENRLRDDRRADESAAEARRHNSVLEGQGAQGLGFEGARLGLERQRVDIARQEAGNKLNGTLTPGQARKTETDLRKEFSALPEVKSYRTIDQAAKTVERLARPNASAQDDIALIYAAMKAYDPNSVVRETEFATAQNAAGVPDQIRNAWNKALKGNRLNPKQRQEMAASVGAVAASARGRFNELEGQYRSYAQDYGANPDRVAPKPAAPSKRPPLNQIFK